MTLIPRNKQLRGLLIGGAALSAVMVGPILVDATAQAQPASCAAGGVCLTPVTAPGGFTTTVTTTAPGTTDTVTTTAPGTTRTVTSTAPGTTYTVTSTAPGTTDTVTTTAPGTTYTVTSTAPATTTTVTQTVTVTSPPVTTTTTTTAPGTTTTVTVTVTSSRTTTNPFTNTTGYTGSYSYSGGVIPGVVRGRPDTESGSACGTPGSAQTLGNNQVETCGPTFGHVAIYATTPGLYNSIFNDDGSYYASAGIFAPQYSFGRLAGCYYVPESSAVPPGDTVSTGGTLANAVAFGTSGRDVSGPVSVSRSDCESSEAQIKAGHPDHVQNRR